MSLILRLFLAAALSLAIARTAAAVTILAVGAEDIDYAVTGSASVNTGASVFRGAWSRGALEIASTSTDPPGNRAALPAFSNQTTIWVHAQLYQDTDSTTASGVQLLRVYGSDGAPRFLIRETGTAGQVKLSTRNTAGTLTDLVTCTAASLPLNSLLQMDLLLTYAVSGTATLYANSAQICTYSGDVTTDGITAVKQVELGGSGPSVFYHAFWSEVIVSDSDTRAMGLVTLAPVAAGNTQSWTPNAVGNINPTSINDANFISSATNNQLSEWTNTTSFPAGTFSVLAVKQSARMLIGSSGPSTFSFLQRPAGSGADFTACSTSPTTSFANYYCLLPNNPNTSAPWAVTDFGSGNNFGVKSTP